MVKRYPHTATVTVTSVTVSDGEYSGSTTDTENSITGRLDKGKPRKMKTQEGDYVQASKVFFTKAEKIENASHLTIDSKSYRILEWMEYQTYQEIWLD